MPRPLTAAQLLQGARAQAARRARGLDPSASAVGIDRRATGEAPDLDLLSPAERLGAAIFERDGRVSRKTQELLARPELEALLSAAARLPADPVRRHAPEAALGYKLRSALGEDRGPLLGGLGDPRLLSPWRLIEAGWELWVDDADALELFWEGEAEGDAGVIELLQVLSGEAEIRLYTQIGAHKETVVFDGGSFYRPPDRGLMTTRGSLR